MNNKERIEKMRETARILNEEADRLSEEQEYPPKPEPGTVVWWRYYGRDEWRIGEVNHSCSGIRGLYWNSSPIYWDSIEWKPARICADDEMVIPRPHTEVWPMTVDRVPAIRADLVWHFIDSLGRCFNQQVAEHGSITRSEAEAMEAQNDHT